jgi:hypothetical protein
VSGLALSHLALINAVVHLIETGKRLSAGALIPSRRDPAAAGEDASQRPGD